MTRRTRVFVGLGVAVAGWLLIGIGADIATAHNASISCGPDGDVHAGGGQYGDGIYTIDGGTPHPFHSGFAVTLDGGTRHTLTVTADDWPTFTGAAGPCRTTTTTGATTSSTTPSTTSTTVVSSSSSAAPTTAPPTSSPSAPSAPPSSTDASTSSTPASSAPPSTEWQVGPPTCDHLTPEQCNATETTSTTSDVSSSTTSPAIGAAGTTTSSVQPSASSTPSTLPHTGPSPLAPEIAGVGILALAAGTGAVVVARRRRP